MGAGFVELDVRRLGLSPRTVIRLEGPDGGRLEVELGAGATRGNFYAPTALADLPAAVPAYREEVFGPVASLFKVKDADAAIALANATPFGLGSSVWTTDEAEQRRFIDELAAGMTFVNAMVASDPACRSAASIAPATAASCRPSASASSSTLRPSTSRRAVTARRRDHWMIEYVPSKQPLLVLPSHGSPNAVSTMPSPQSATRPEQSVLQWPGAPSFLPRPSMQWSHLMKHATTRATAPRPTPPPLSDDVARLLHAGLRSSNAERKRQAIEACLAARAFGAGFARGADPERADRLHVIGPHPEHGLRGDNAGPRAADHAIARYRRDQRLAPNTALGPSSPGPSAPNSAAAARTPRPERARATRARPSPPLTRV